MVHFSVKAPPSAEEALTKIHTRYDKLNTDDFINILVSRDPQAFVATFQQLPRALHAYLFNDILSNAGEYRKANDPGGGVVYFIIIRGQTQ